MLFRSCNALCEGVDIVPTMLDWCGVQIPSFLQGKSLAGLLKNPEDRHREDVLVEFFEPHGGRQTMLRTERYKYCLDAEGRERMYDMALDPKEISPIYPETMNASMLSILSDMRRRMLIRTREAAYPSREKTAAY